MFRVVIPARYASSRLPGKALLVMAGKPMIQWVYEQAVASRAQEVLIATENPLVVSAAHSFAGNSVMTSPTHTSGTDRIAEVARSRGWSDSDIIVNVQGDEPLIPPSLIDQVAVLLESNPGAQVATLATPMGSATEFLDPNVVKVVTDVEGRALYFSRSPIPWYRDGSAAAVQADQRSWAGARRHVGLYGYRVGSLLKLASLAPTPLEQFEMLEQLRALENGLEIRVADAVERPGPDVNTAADLERVTELLRRRMQD